MAETAVDVKDLSKRYGDRVVVDDVGFVVEAGEIFGILGPNGAGKTTTVESIAGLRIGDAGSVRVHGIDPWTDRRSLTRVLGIQLQESRLQPKITVREALELWSALHPDPEPWPGLAERLGLEPHLDQRFVSLSGGQQQRLSIALALVGRPRVVILDELSTGLDPRARRDVWQLVRDVRDAGATVLLVTHAMEEAQELCDRIAIVDHGRITALDTPDGLIEAAGALTRTSFVPSAPTDLEALRAIRGVASVRRADDRVVVEGIEDAALAVLSALAGQQVVPHRLRVSGATLDTAYLDLTAHPDKEFA
ncbi:putative ABC transporter, ATP-binding subunit [Nostocoides japonicum T1-X7]|uniref:Putative ABC transporter, ATP-binding subunit n=1 Tax=Nostocoides japonicum T1-X7 TaxID=1194083 RepID=A0A077M2G4_9MICO|nr:ABC transporter ATP-binding protein [Tetrasphaera japonica]CCH80016.1 putative ABC transporter, ATP-binding subunit [Tetrasphaera japonica T1-X7]